MLTVKEIDNLEILEKTYNKSCKTGNGLILEISSRKKGGAKCFVGRTRFNKKQIPVYIGAYGKNVGKIKNVPQANAKWIKILEWSKENNKNPKDFGKKELSEIKTLEDAINGFLKEKKEKIKETSYKEYFNKLKNQVLSHIDKDTPLKDLEWGDGNGRKEIMRVIEAIKDGGKGNNIDLSRRCQDRLKDTFNFAIRKGWMTRGENPAERIKGDSENDHTPTHHKSITWEEVPKFLKAVNLNVTNCHPMNVLATKFMLITSLRAGCLTRLKWQMIKKVQGIRCIEISGDTSGLKRKKGKNDHIPHHIPLTKELDALLVQLKEYSTFGKNGMNEYIFTPIRESRFPHLDPSAPNNFLRNIGYQNLMVAHGWRSVALTEGQNILGINYEIIQRQMGHLLGDKVRKAYDNSLMLKERKKYLEEWGNLLVQTGLRI